MSTVYKLYTHNLIAHLITTDYTQHICCPVQSDIYLMVYDTG